MRNSTTVLQEIYITRSPRAMRFGLRVRLFALLGRMVVTVLVTALRE